MRLTDVDALLKCIPYEDVNSRFAVQNAPIIEERKIGKWVITKTERGWNCAEYPTEVTCSNCNYIEDYQKALDFCPNCGADMRGEDMSRYIDADKLQETFKELHGGKRSLLIDTQPTADVVEVVRCKDCKYWVKDGNESFGYAMFCEHGCSLGGQGIKNPDDYCSYGERTDI